MEALAVLSAIVLFAVVIIWVIGFGWRDGPQKQNFSPPEPPTFGNEPREQEER